MAFSWASDTALFANPVWLATIHNVVKWKSRCTLSFSFHGQPIPSDWPTGTTRPANHRLHASHHVPPQESFECHPETVQVSPQLSKPFVQPTSNQRNQLTNSPLPTSSSRRHCVVVCRLSFVVRHSSFVRSFVCCSLSSTRSFISASALENKQR